MYQNPNRFPYNPKLKERAKSLRNNMTEPEKKLWFQFLRKLPLYPPHPTGVEQSPHNTLGLGGMNQNGDNPPRLRGKTNEVSRGSFLRVLRQRPIGNFIVDFYIPTHTLVIEIDGESHFSETAQDYDRERSEFLQSLGIQILRFTNREVMEEFEGVCERILDYICY